MKKIVRNNRVLGFVFFAAFTFGILPVKANDSDHVRPSPVEMKRIGSLNDQPMFQIRVNSTPDQNEFTITVKDEFNEVLYFDYIQGENFSKKFLLNADELGDATLIFEIFNRKAKQTTTYEINRHTRLIDEFAVTLRK